MILIILYTFIGFCIIVAFQITENFNDPTSYYSSDNNELLFEIHF
jgi:hypothetical protein